MPLSSLLIALWLGLAPSRPVDAIIVDDLPIDKDGNVVCGNVQVDFADGHHEKWTRGRHAMFPHVSTSGLVGWCTFHGYNYQGMPMNDKVRVCWPDGHHQDFPISTYPFVEEWHFLHNSTRLMIKSRGAHGPAAFIEYDLATGKLLDQAYGIGPSLPDWARPYSD